MTREQYGTMLRQIGIDSHIVDLALSAYDIGFASGRYGELPGKPLDKRVTF